MTQICTVIKRSTALVLKLHERFRIIYYTYEDWKSKKKSINDKVRAIE